MDAPDHRRHRSEKRTWVREELLQLLAVAATLAGLSITSVALLHTVGHTRLTPTIADDVLMLSALLFLLCTYAIFFALRTLSRGQRFGGSGGHGSPPPSLALFDGAGVHVRALDRFRVVNGFGLWHSQ